MMERGKSPEEVEARKFNVRKALERFENSLREQGKRVMCILGPAIALGGPAFAGEREQTVEAAPDSEMHCDVAWVNEQGEKVGESSIPLPDLEDLPIEDATYELVAKHTGDQTREAIGLVTETSREKKPESHPDKEERSFQEKVKIAAKKVQEQSFNAKMPGDAHAYGWTFKVDTSQSARWSGHDARLTVAAVIPADYGAKQIMAGKAPSEMGAFVKLTVRPK
jgi:hypothetical protein